MLMTAITHVLICNQIKDMYMNKERIHIEGEFSLQRRSNPNKRLTKIGFM